MAKKRIGLCMVASLTLWGTLFGAASAQYVPMIPPAQAAAAPAPVSVTSPTTAPGIVYDYRLGAGDKVRMIVFGEDALGGEFAISGDGKVSLPLIGEIPAAGLTSSQLQENIQAAYKTGYLKDPRVNIEVLNFRPFYILGEVNKPGEYPYGNGMTVVNAVALASGFTYRANKKKVFIKHVNGDREEEVPLDANAVVAPGDTVRIVERYF